MLNTDDRILLENRCVISLSGDDRRSFLQGIITNNVNAITENNAIFSALLSPQGKFLYDFFLIEKDKVLYLETHRNFTEGLIKRLTLYRLRAKVDIQLMPHLQVAVSAHPQKDVFCSYQDPRHPALGYRIIGEKLNAAITDGYEKLRYSLGIPEGAIDLTENRSLLLEWHYDALHAIDFHKGCYVGQEVTARSKHRATLHKTMFQVKASAHSLPPKGTAITLKEREVGQMAGSYGNQGLAVISVDAVKEKPNLQCGEVQIIASVAEWAKEK